MPVGDTSEADAADAVMMGARVDGRGGQIRGGRRSRQKDKRSARLGCGCLGWHAVSC